MDEVITTVIMSRVTDFFGFFVYAIASALVFPALFFPNFDPVTGTLLSFGIFSLAFIARPFAYILGRWVQTVIGRPGKVTVALLVFGTSTMAIGFLPGYATIGIWAPIMLAVLRFGQGIGLGAAWDGITLKLQTAAPKGKEVIYAMVPQLGGPIGFIVAASLFYVLTGFLTEEEFMSFGWRFAFFGVLAVNVVSLFARIRLMTADFGGDEMDQTATQTTPLVPLIKHQWKPILLSTMLPLASYALFHMVTVFPVAYAYLYIGHDIHLILLWQLIGATLAIGSVVASGILADRIGRYPTLAIASALIVPLCFVIPTMDGNPAVYIVLGFVVLGLLFGQASAIAPARFDPKYCFSGSALSVNLSWIVGAAFAPLIGVGLTAAYGLGASAAYLLSGVVVTWIALYFHRKWKDQPAEAS
ncbi:MAG: MFS transporter [Pseudomonadota bacterium]